MRSPSPLPILITVGIIIVINIIIVILVIVGITITTAVTIIVIRTDLIYMSYHSALIVVKIVESTSNTAWMKEVALTTGNIDKLSQTSQCTHHSGQK